MRLQAGSIANPGPIELPLKTGSCDCKEKTLFLYQKALLDIRVWPLERTFSQTSVAGLLDRLKSFKYESEHQPCPNCTIYCEDVVEDTIRKVKGYFDGLCLVCMAKTEPGAPKNADYYYWYHDQIKDWDRDCRKKGVSHGEPTWYYSYMSTRNYKDARENWYQLQRRFDDDDDDFL